MKFLIQGYKSKSQQILSHIVFWLLYISVYSLIVSIPVELTFWDLLKRTLYFLPVDIIITYILIYALLPLLFKKKYLFFSLFFIVLAVITPITNQIINYYIYLPIYHPEYLEKYTFWQFNYFYFTISSLSIALFAAAIKLLKQWVKEQQHRNFLQNQNLQSELALLKNQINPHFIFNTLNNIDSLIAIEPSKASESIMRLSDIMRYVLYEATADFVPLEKEINYLKNFISLHALRLSPGFFEFNSKPVRKDLLIAPMLFIPLVENAIKHGDKKVKHPGIKMYLEADDHRLCFEVRNFLSDIRINKDNAGGIGMINLRRRLDLLYPDKHTLETIIVDNKEYKVRLCIH
ncbi:MAG: histidine kinase [Bacteroidales bacterium]|nr:histidine kinase [Bacteroidales bacterium]